MQNVITRVKGKVLVVLINVAGVNDIGNASPVSIGTERNSGKN